MSKHKHLRAVFDTVTKLPTVTVIYNYYIETKCIIFYKGVHLHAPEDG